MAQGSLARFLGRAKDVRAKQPEGRRCHAAPGAPGTNGALSEGLCLESEPCSSTDVASSALTSGSECRQTLQSTANKNSDSGEAKPSSRQRDPQTRADRPHGETGGVSRQSVASRSRKRKQSSIGSGQQTLLQLLQARSSTTCPPGMSKASDGGQAKSNKEASPLQNQLPGRDEEVCGLHAASASQRSDNDADKQRQLSGEIAGPSSQSNALAELKWKVSCLHEGQNPAKGQIKRKARTTGCERQLHLDLGQADFFLKRCDVCSLVFAPGNPRDEQIHADFHRKTLSGIKLKGAHKWRQIMKDNMGHVVLVSSIDSAAQRNKVKQVCAHVEQELGVTTGWLQSPDCKAFLYLSHTQQVFGLVLMESIRWAHRVLSDKSRGAATASVGDREDTGRGGDADAGAGAPVSPDGTVAKSNGTAHSLGRVGVLVADLAEKIPAICGIRAVWVAPNNRRKGIGSKLLDAARSHCMTGYVVPRCEVAFSHPTDSGRALAAVYTSTPSFLIY